MVDKHGQPTPDDVTQGRAAWLHTFSACCAAILAMFLVYRLGHVLAGGSLVP